jgi:hypothetical protein
MFNVTEGQQAHQPALQSQHTSQLPTMNRGARTATMRRRCSSQPRLPFSTACRPSTGSALQYQLWNGHARQAADATERQQQKGSSRKAPACDYRPFRSDAGPPTHPPTHPPACA